MSYSTTRFIEIPGGWIAVAGDRTQARERERLRTGSNRDRLAEYLDLVWSGEEGVERPRQGNLEVRTSAKPAP